MNKQLVIIGLLVTLAAIAGTPPAAHALDPMRIAIRTDLPPRIATVGDAARYYADAIGYRLTTSYPAPAESAAIAGEPVNPLAHTSGIKPVEEAILGLLRPDCLLVIDRDHKLFSFENRGDIP